MRWLLGGMICLLLGARPARGDADILLMKARQGGPVGEAAYGELYATQFDSLVRITSAREPRIAQMGRAEDAVQNTFLLFWETPDEQKADKWEWFISNARNFARRIISRERRIALIEFGEGETDDGNYRYQPEDEFQLAPDEVAVAREEADPKEHETLQTRLNIVASKLPEDLAEIARALASGESITEINEKLGLEGRRARDQYARITRRVSKIQTDDRYHALDGEQRDFFLSTLDDVQRRIVIAFHRGILFPDIAAQMNLPVHRIHELHRKAMQRLGELCKDEDAFTELATAYAVARRFTPLPIHEYRPFFNAYLSLTEEERAVLRLRWAGSSNEEIVQEIGYHEKDYIRKIIARVCRKIGSALNHEVKLIPAPRDFFREANIPRDLFSNVTKKEEETLVRHLASLSDDDLEILRLRRRGFHFSKIGEILQRTMQSVFFRYTRILKHLNAQMGRRKETLLALAPPQADHAANADRLSTTLFSSVNSLNRPRLALLLKELTPRSLKILEWADAGLPHRLIARNLNMSLPDTNARLEELVTRLAKPLRRRLTFSFPERPLDPMAEFRSRYFRELEESRQPEIDAFLSALSDPVKSIFAMRVEGFTFEQIAASLSLTANGVQARFFKTLHPFRQSLGLPPFQKQKKHTDDDLINIAIIFNFWQPTAGEQATALEEELKRLSSARLRVLRRRIEGIPIREIAAELSVDSKTADGALRTAMATLAGGLPNLALELPPLPAPPEESTEVDEARLAEMPTDIFREVKEISRERLAEALATLSDTELAVLRLRHKEVKFPDQPNDFGFSSQKMRTIRDSALRKLRLYLSLGPDQSLKFAPSESSLSDIQTILAAVPDISPESRKRLQEELYDLNPNQLEAMVLRLGGASPAQIAETRGATLTNFARDFKATVARLENAMGTSFNFPPVVRRRASEVDSPPDSNSPTPCNQHVRNGASSTTFQ